MSFQASKILSHCPLCKETYPEDSLRHLGGNQGANTYHCTCRACGHTMVAVILEQAGLVSSIGMITDLEVNDALRFYKAESIKQDECVEAHRILTNQSREFCDLLLK